MAQGFTPIVEFYGANAALLNQRIMHWKHTAANAERDVQTQRASGNSRDRLTVVIAHTHYGTLAELTFDLTQGRSQGFLLVVVH